MRLWGYTLGHTACSSRSTECNCHYKSRAKDRGESTGLVVAIGLGIQDLGRYSSIASTAEGRQTSLRSSY